MIKEFRDFIARGNVIDLAVGVIIGAAFGAIIKAVVAELLNPLIGALIGRDLSNWFYVVGGQVFETLDAAREAGALVFGYGRVLQVTIEFVLTAFVLFLIVKAYNQMRKKQAEEAPAAPPAPPREEVLLEEIRDLLASPKSKSK